jgi:hypothetical protein
LDDEAGFFIFARRGFHKDTDKSKIKDQKLKIRNILFKLGFLPKF